MNSKALAAVLIGGSIMTGYILTGIVCYKVGECKGLEFAEEQINQLIAETCEKHNIAIEDLAK